VLDNYIKYYFTFAWRNIWRNKKRSILATSSIFFAVFLALAMRSLQFGQYEYMVNFTVSLYTGYLQLQAKGFWDNRSFDESFEFNDTLYNKLKNYPGISNINPRIETAALISHVTETRISPVIGIDPDLEDKMTGLKKRLFKGEYLNENSKGILIAEGLADRLNVDVGDSIVVFGQGFQGVIAAQVFHVQGIIKFPIPKMNNAFVFMTIKNAQELFNLSNRITSIPIMINNPSKLYEFKKELSARIDSNLVVMTWEEMSPEIVQAIEVDNASGFIMLLILYVVIGFGVFGTIVMMTLERTREFGLLISLGMERDKIYLVTTIESILISFFGALLGVIVAFPVLLYFYFNPIPVSGEIADIYLSYGMEPIIPFSIDSNIFISQMLIVFLISLLTSLYPISFIRKIRPVSALQGRGGMK